MGKFVVPDLTGSSGDARVVVGINTAKCGDKDVSLQAGVLFGARGDKRGYAGKMVLISHMFVTYLTSIYLLSYSRGWVSP